MRRLRLVDPELPAAPAAAALLALDEGPCADALRRAGAAELPAAAPRGAAAESFAREYAAFLGAVNRERASREWWSLTVAGKNPTVSPLPRRCWQWKQLCDALESWTDGDLAVVTADAVLAEAARAWAVERGFTVSGAARDRRGLKARLNELLPSGPLFGFARALWRAIRVRTLCRWAPEPGRRYAVIATLLNHQSFLADGSYRDTYFGELSARLGAAGEHCLVFGSITHDFERTLKRSQGQPGAPILPMERFLALGDLLLCLWSALKLRLSPPRFSEPLIFAGRDVAPFLEAELRANVQASRFFHDLLYFHATRALLRRVRPSRIFYPFENRCWERMIALAARESAPEACVIGYQHASTTANHLNFVLGPGEEKLLPLPDRVITLGEITRQRLIARGGLPAEKLRLGCALRQGPAPETRRGPAPAKKLLVTLATSVKEYAAVLKLLDEAFRDGGPEIRVRAHPEFPLDDGVRRAGKLSFRYDESQGGIDEAMRWSDTVLFASSTLGLEAVRQGIPAVYLQVADFLDLDPLYDFDDLKWTARDAGQLKAALAQIAALPEPELSSRRERAAAYASRYLGARTEESLAAFDPSPARTAIPLGDHS